MKTIKYITLLCITFFVISCDKFIEEEPTSVITSNSFWRTEADAVAGTIGIYDKLQYIYRGEFGSYIHWTDGRADVAQPGQTDGSNGVLLNNRLDPRSAGSWTGLYKAINMANLAITNIPNIEMDPVLKEQLLGEAYFIRAYCYFLAARLWGDVPLLIEPIDNSASDDLKPTRSPRASVLDQVRLDIEKSLSLVPVGYGVATFDRGRATVGAVNALKLDFLLWMARVENSGAADLLGAIEAAQQILGNEMYQLIPNFGDIFRIKNTNETIWAIQYDAAKQENYNLGANLTPLSQGPYTGGKMNYEPSEKVKNAFKVNSPNDSREAATILEFGEDLIGATSMYIKYIGSPAQGTQRNFDSNIMIYRVGGIKLMFAEALNESGRTSEAISELNDVRARAGLPNTLAVSQEEVRQAILDEHLLEMPFEGSRWFTLIRSGRIAEEVESIQTNVFDQNSSLVWPISEDALRQNENLTQNGAYGG